MPEQDRLPTGIGYYDNWPSETGGSKYDDVDDPVGSPDDDTTAIWTSGITGTRPQSFVCAAFALPAGATVDKVSVTSRQKITVGSSYQNYNEVYVDNGVPGTKYAGSALALTSSYGTFTTDFLTNPGTGSAWTKDEIEGTAATQAFVGFGIRAYCSSRLIHCTQNYATVTYTAGAGAGVNVAGHYYRNLMGAGA